MRRKLLAGLITSTLFVIIGFVPTEKVWSAAPTAEPVYEALNPRGTLPPIKITPLAPRISNLENKVIYVINNHKEYAEPLFAAIADLLRQRFPSAEVKHVYKKTNFMVDDPALFKEVKERASAVIMGTKD